MPRKPPVKRPAAALEKYRAKRDFKQTPEPSSGNASEPGKLFVIQEHHARSHHFDLRLEMDGVLTSWAVPKGPPEDKAAKRLAVHVEDHPLEYATFEGEIPKGNYGAGTVAIWDRGEWLPLDSDWRTAFSHGKMKFFLRGKKLDGAYVLARMGDEPNWLMRMIDPPGGVKIGLPEPEPETPQFVAPQLARVVPAVPSGKDWLHELKFDGYRLIAVRSSGRVTLFTRNELDWTDRFRGLAKAFEDLPGGDYVLDGEAVVFDEKGRTTFGGLQEALKANDWKSIKFVVFDILNDEGKNLRGLPLAERLKFLDKRLPGDTDLLRRSKIWNSAEGEALFKEACKNLLEGIISKNPNGKYIPGSRKDWVKSKCRPHQEFVICGYTAPKGSRSDFGALYLASHENGKWVPRGKVGTGYSEGTRRSLLKQMEPLIVTSPPFPSSERDVTWLRPQLVAEVEFAEITRDGSIRQGSFVSLREDKPADEVQMDTIQTATTDRKSIEVAGVSISHPDRVVYPGDGITKLEVARYFESVGELMLPFVANRPLALLRAPDGISGDTFFQKSFKAHLPAHVKESSLEDGTEICYVKSVPGLVSLAQFGAIEFHPWGSKLSDVDKPDVLIWDLDPDPAVPWKEILGAAFLLRDYLAERNLKSVVKTSGGKGLHVMIYLKRNYTWDVLKPFTKAVAMEIGKFNPRRFTVESSLKKRSGKIFIDYLRNGRGATCIAPWGLRARKGATVSMPINWSDLFSLDPAGFTIKEPPQAPQDWKEIRPQTITKGFLSELGVLQ